MHHYNSVNSKHAHRTQAFVTLSVPGKGHLSENLCSRVGHLSILLEVVKVVSFSLFHKRIHLDSFIKNIFNTYALKWYVWFWLHHFPTLQYFLHLSKKLLPTNVISLHMEEKQSIYRSKSLKENTLSLRVNCELWYINTNFTYCTINVTIQRFHHDEKILT